MHRAAGGGLAAAWPYPRPGSATVRAQQPRPCVRLGRARGAVASRGCPAARPVMSAPPWPGSARQARAR
eukprot:scaffold73971_cov64-Phaeocystis_antarctica.AAC.3